MRQSIGEISTLNIIIIFMVIVFGLLSATLSYYKAFKLNTRILDIIEKYEGYNSLSKPEIENNLNSMGYAQIHGNFSCPTIGESGNQLEEVLSQDEYVNANLSGTDRNRSHFYCVYYVSNDSGQNDAAGTYYNYIVVTYIFIDLPIVGEFKVPVRTKGERIYSFSD